MYNYGNYTKHLNIGRAVAPPAPTPLSVQDRNILYLSFENENEKKLTLYRNCWMTSIINRGGGSNAKLGGRELTSLCGFNQYTLLQNRDNSGLLGTPCIVA